MSEVAAAAAASTTRDLLSTVPHFSHDAQSGFGDDEDWDEVEQYPLESLEFHSPTEIHTGRRRLLVGRGCWENSRGQESRRGAHQKIRELHLRCHWKDDPVHQE